MTAVDTKPMRDLGSLKTTDRCAEVFNCLEVKEHVPEAVVTEGRIDYECRVCWIRWAVVDGEEAG